MFGVKLQHVRRIGVAITLATITLCLVALPAFALGCYEDVTVTGAGSSQLNRWFAFENMFFGKPAYTIGTQYAIYWFHPHLRWVIEDDHGVLYYANDADTPTPPRTGWYVVSGGLPAPTLFGGEKCVDPTPPLAIVITGVGGGGDSFLDLPLVLGEGEDPPMVGLLPLCGVFEVGETITGGCAICDVDGSPVRTSYIHVYLYAVDLSTVPETLALLDHWTVHHDKATGQYRFEVETDGWKPGYYDIRLSFADGSAQELRIEIIAPETG